jgi:hypothetical protein
LNNSIQGKFEKIIISNSQSNKIIRDKIKKSNSTNKKKKKYRFENKKD